jgi:hypothetical protein
VLFGNEFKLRHGNVYLWYENLVVLENVSQPEFVKGRLSTLVAVL